MPTPLESLPEGFTLLDENENKQLGQKQSPISQPIDYQLPEGFTLIDEEAPLASSPTGIKRYAQDVAAGAVGSAAATLKGATWIGSAIADTRGSYADQLAGRMREWSQDLTPDDAAFTDQLLMGAGSAATFFIPGLGISRGVSLLSQTPRLASWLGVGVSSAMEAMAEGGDSYQEAKSRGLSDSEANRVAHKTFWSNLALITLTNKAGVFSEAGGGLLRKIVMSSGMEGLQEGAQTGIQNIALGDPLNTKELGTSAAIGAIVGGGMGAITNGADTLIDHYRSKTEGSKPQPTQDAQEAIDIAKVLLTHKDNPQSVEVKPPVMAPKVKDTTTQTISASAKAVTVRENRPNFNGKNVSKYATESVTPDDIPDHLIIKKQASAITEQNQLGEKDTKIVEQTVLIPEVPQQTEGKKKVKLVKSTEAPAAQATAVSSLATTEKEQVVFHRSKKKLKEGMPTFDSYYGTETFKNFFSEEFGPHVYKIIIPRGTAVIDLDKDNAQTREFISMLALDIANKSTRQDTKESYIEFSKQAKLGPVDRDEFYDIWTLKDEILPTLRKLGYAGASFQEEFILTKELIAKLSTDAGQPQATVEAPSAASTTGASSLPTPAATVVPQASVEATVLPAPPEAAISAPAMKVKTPNTAEGVQKLLVKNESRLDVLRESLVKSSTKTKPSIQAKIDQLEGKQLSLTDKMLQLRGRAKDISKATTKLANQEVLSLEEAKIVQVAADIDLVAQEIGTVADIESEEYKNLDVQLTALLTQEAKLYAGLVSKKNISPLTELAPFSDELSRSDVTVDKPIGEVKQEAQTADTLKYPPSDIRGQGKKAYRFANGDIITGETFESMTDEVISSSSTRGGKAEKGYLDPDGVFISDSLLRSIEAPSGKKGKNKKLAKLLSTLKNERGSITFGLGSNMNEEQLKTLSSLRLKFIQLEIEARQQKLSLEEYLRKSGFSEDVITAYKNIKNLPVQAGEVIGYITESQKKYIAELINESGQDIETLKKTYGISSNLDRLTYTEANKLIAGLGPESAETFKLQFDNEDHSKLARSLFEQVWNRVTGVSNKAAQALLSPKSILSVEEAGRSIYNDVDRADINMHRTFAHIMSEKGMSQIMELIPEGTSSAEKVATALDGKISTETLNKTELKAYEAIRDFYDWALNKFVSTKVRPENEIKVREFAKQIPYSPSEDEEQIIKRMKGFRRKNILNTEEMKAVDLLRMRKADYLPHVFDRDSLLYYATTELFLEKNKLGEKRNPKRIHELQELISRLQGGDIILYKSIPKSIQFGHLKKRLGVEGYKLDANVAFHTYLHGFLREIHVTPTLPQLRENYKKLSPALKPYGHAYISDFLGYTQRSPVAQFVRQTEWLRTLGFSPRAAIVNAIGGNLNTMIEGGNPKHIASGLIRAMSKEGRAEFELSGAPVEIQSVRVFLDKTYATRMEKLRYYAGWFFNKVEYGLRSTAYHTGKAKGESLGLSGEDLFYYSMDFMHKTQYRYGKVGMPMGMRGWGGVVFQYSSYSIKTFELMRTWMKEGRSGILKLFTFIMAAEGGEWASRNWLGLDVSGALGFGVRWEDALAAMMSATDDAWEDATRQLTLAKAPSGLVDFSFGPAVDAVIGTTKEFSLPQVLHELSPIQMERLRDFYFSLRYSQDGEYPVFKYSNPSIVSEPTELKYTLNLKDTILKAFGPKPSVDTEAQRQLFNDMLKDREIAKILERFDRALRKGDEKEYTRLLSHYSSIVGDRDMKGVLQQEMKLNMTREERELLKGSDRMFDRMMLPD